MVSCKSRLAGVLVLAWFFGFRAELKTRPGVFESVIFGPFSTKIGCETFRVEIIQMVEWLGEKINITHCTEKLDV